MTISTTEVNQVLKTWANSFIEDVPAVHRGGEYFIEYHTLIEHLNNLEYDQLVEIMLEAREEHLRDPLTGN